MSLSHVPLQSIQRFWDIPMTMETLMYTLSLQKNNLGMVKTKKSPPLKKNGVFTPNRGPAIRQRSPGGDKI
jgi:hypothetical protein